MAEMDQLDTSGEVSPDQARVFRTCVGILLYLASYLPHCQHVVRHLSTYSTQPTTCSMTILRHLVSYLACHEDICVSLRWRGRNSGLFHQYGSAAEYAMEIFTDSDWASNKETRCSISCSTYLLGKLFAVLLKPYTENWFLSAVQKLKFMHAVQALQMDCYWQVSSLG